MTLKELREKRNFTQVDLAEMLKTKQNTVYNWENGKSKPNVLKTIELSKALKVSVDTVVKCFKE